MEMNYILRDSARESSGVHSILTAFIQLSCYGSEQISFGVKTFVSLFDEAANRIIQLKARLIF